MRSANIALRVLVFASVLPLGIHAESGQVVTFSAASFAAAGPAAPAAGAWGTRAPLLEANSEMAVAELYGKIYVAGGCPPHGHDFAVYDPGANTWRRLDPMPVPVHGVTGAAFLDGLIYLAGGGIALGGSSGSTIHQVYRPNMSCR